MNLLESIRQHLIEHHLLMHFRRRRVSDTDLPSLRSQTWAPNDGHGYRRWKPKLQVHVSSLEYKRTNIILTIKHLIQFCSIIITHMDTAAIYSHAKQSCMNNFPIAFIAFALLLIFQSYTDQINIVIHSAFLTLYAVFCEQIGLDFARGNPANIPQSFIRFVKLLWDRWIVLIQIVCMESVMFYASYQLSMMFMQQSFSTYSEMFSAFNPGAELTSETLQKMQKMVTPQKLSLLVTMAYLSFCLFLVKMILGILLNFTHQFVIHAYNNRTNQGGFLGVLKDSAKRMSKGKYICAYLTLCARMWWVFIFSGTFNCFFYICQSHYFFAIMEEERLQRDKFQQEQDRLVNILRELNRHHYERQVANQSQFSKQNTYQKQEQEQYQEQQSEGSPLTKQVNTSIEPPEHFQPTRSYSPERQPDAAVKRILNPHLYPKKIDELVEGFSDYFAKSKKEQSRRKQPVRFTYRPSRNKIYFKDL